MKNKFLTLFLAAILILSLAACGNKTDSNSYEEGSSQVEEEDNKASEGETGAVRSEAKDEKDVQLDTNLIEEALKNMNAASSMEAQMHIEMGFEIINSAGEKRPLMDNIAKVNTVCFYEPAMRIKADTSVNTDMMGRLINTSKTTIYADTMEDGSVMIYMYNGQTWQSSTNSTVILETVDARKSMSDYIMDASLYTQVGMEEVNGVNTYKYAYTVPKDEMKYTLINIASDAVKEVLSFGMDQSQLNSILEDVGEVVVYVWVDTETLYPVKVEMDMTEGLNELGDKLMAYMVENVKKGSGVFGVDMPNKWILTMTCSKFNAATDFSIPDEAKNAN